MEGEGGGRGEGGRGERGAGHGGRGRRGERLLEILTNGYIYWFSTRDVTRSSTFPSYLKIGPWFPQVGLEQ